jgi:hypothetical protein
MAIDERMTAEAKRARIGVVLLESMHGDVMARAMCSLEPSETVASHLKSQIVPAIPVSEDDFYAD